MVFKRRVIKNYWSIWAISRSSRFLYKKMTNNIDFSKSLKIVEFWPWDWVFTDKILNKITNDSKIYIFEIDKWFCEILKEKYKNETKIKVFEESACNIENYFKENEIDIIISSLPLAFIDKSIVEEILKKSKKVLKNNWEYIQYQYFLQNKKQIKSHFSRVNYKFTFLNFPPAFVYLCKK